MTWNSLLEEKLYTLARNLLMRHGRPEDPVDPYSCIEVRVHSVYDHEILISGELESPGRIDIYIESDRPILHDHVLCTDAHGNNPMCPYEDASYPTSPGKQREIYEALKRFSVLDDLASI
ncbi:MAG: hypothetical protein AB7L09_01785 [Nitrospira sp.]